MFVRRTKPKSDDAAAALNAALRILTRREYSKLELYNKLLERYTKEAARQAFQVVLDNYTRQELRNKSSLEYTLSYSHGYNPVRPGDCVLFDYKRSGFANVKAKVISQSIECSAGCTVQETAVYTTNLWGAAS